MSPELEACRLSDALLGDAYEATPPERRAWIKTTLALVEATHPPLPSCSEQRTESAATGYGNIVRRTVAPWAALVIGSDYPSAVRLSAAIMSARLAGVEPLVAIWTGRLDAIPPALLAALELTGVEQCFALPDATRLVERLLAERSHEEQNPCEGVGRLLGFGVALRETACRLGVPLWEDLRDPHVGVTAGLDTDTIRWAHPDATLVPVTPTTGATSGQPPHNGIRYDALYAPASASLAHVQASLRLSPGLEGAWVCPDLSPAFFINAERFLYRL